VDLGEGFAFDQALMEFATSVNICLGVHAGSPALTRKTIELASERNLRWGLHPGYPDRTTMGRAPIELQFARTYLQSIFEQVLEWSDFGFPDYLKPHGAFYNDTAVPMPDEWPHGPKSEETSLFLNQFPGVNSLGMLLRMRKLPLMGMSGTAHETIASRYGHGFIREGFADRRYGARNRLLPRSSPDSLLKDTYEIKEQVLRLATTVDSICVHGDTLEAVEVAATVRRTLEDAGYVVSPGRQHEFN
jgi:UPF0271 protein